MLRKILLTSGLLSLTLITPSFAGFYTGAAIGPEGARFSQKAFVTQTGASFLSTVDTEQHSGVGGFGSIFAGYSGTHERFYLAGELNANLSTLKYSQGNNEYFFGSYSRTIFRINRSFGASILPGYLVTNNTLLYARLGYTNGHLKVSEGDTSIGSFHKDLDGFRYGVGMQHALTPRLAIRMDYSQIDYKSVNRATFDPVGVVTKQTKISPYTAQVAFGLIYQFDAPAALHTS